MAAVLAVALLLLCGNVYSVEEEALSGYVTQVKTGDSNSTVPVASPDTAPALSSPTGDSGSTQTAVLSALPQDENSEVTLVDLARADDEQMNMKLGDAAAQAPAEGDSAIPDGFDMTEDDAPSSYEEEAPAPQTPVSDSALPADEETAGGTMVSGVDDTNYPNLPNATTDFSNVPGYGVQSASSDEEATTDDEVTASDEAEAVSFSTSAEDSSEGGGGTMVSDVDDTNYPNLPDSPDQTTGRGYGVVGDDAEAASGDEAEAVSFSTSAEDSSEGGGGTMVSDVDDTNYPNLPDSPDQTTGRGYGVVGDDAEAASGDEAEAVSFSTSAEDSSEGGGGTMVSDVDDTNYPNLPDSPDQTTGRGYGVVGDDAEAASGDEAEAVSFSTSAEDSSEGGGGTMVSDVDDTNYPNLPDSPDQTTGRGYGVVGDDAEAASGDEAEAISFSTSAEDSSEGGGGTMVSDVDDTNYPNLPDSPDQTTGRGYGVVGDDAEAASGDEAEAVSFSTSAEDSSEGGGGTMVSDVDDTNYPNLPDSPDQTTGRGYGVVGDDAEAASGDEAEAVSFSTSAEDSSEGGGGMMVSDVDDTNYPNLPDSPDQTTGRGHGVVGDDAEAASGDEAVSDTSAVTLRARSYTPPPTSRATWGKGKCTYYGGMDAAGTMSGACGYGNLYASGYGAYTAALSSALFKNGVACGACYEVSCTGKSCKAGSVQVTVTNFCPPNPALPATNGGWCNGANKHFDLSYPAFAKIADPKAGVVDLNYRRVPCTKKGGVRFTLNGNCNFNLVTITNVGGSGVVTAVYMKGDGMVWAPLSRNWGANWQCSRNYCGKGIFIKIVTSDKKVSVSRLAGNDWAFGKTYIGKQVK